MIELLMVFATASIAATPARTAVLSSASTADFVSQCDGKATDLTSTFCTGYIMGAFDALTLDGKVCARSKEATTLAAIAGTRKYVADHPEQWSENPIFIVRRALEGIFPCR